MSIGGAASEGPPVRLVCLDFDGTSVIYEDDGQAVFAPEIIEILNRAGRQGVQWCTNSGRSAEDQEKVIARSVELGLASLPCILLSGESYIHRLEDGRYVPLEPWNREAELHAAEVHAEVHRLLMPVLAELVSGYEVVVENLGERSTAFCISNDPDREAPARFFQSLSRLLASVKDARVIRNGGWSAVIPERFGKGMVLAEASRTLGLDEQEVLAVGDHHNDLCMLDGRFGFRAGCPGDALEEIRNIVLDSGGTAASLPGPAGTVEILQRMICWTE